MINRNYKIIMILVSILLLMACNYSIMSPTIQPLSGPELTMTALFGSGILGSLTPPATIQAAQVTNTPILIVIPADTATPGPPTPAVTETPTAMLTSVPATAVPARPAPVVIAYYRDRPIIIDGNWDDFKPVEYGAAHVTYGKTYWKDAADLSSSFRIEWDEQFLYIAARVLDDVYVQNSKGNYLYLGDSLEILLDTDLYGDFYYNQLSADDFQLGISPGRYGLDGVKEAYLWYPTSVKGPRSQVVIASTVFSGGYQVEAAIPWGVFNLVPVEGDHYGFAFSVSDNDHVGASVQQSMVSNAPNRHLTMPMTWGELVLIK